MRKIQNALSAIGKMKRGTIKDAVAKTERLDMRLSADDKASIQHTAQDCGCTVSEYLLRLHYLASRRLG